MIRSDDAWKEIEAMTLHAVAAGRFTPSERQRWLKAAGGICAIQDCTSEIERWLTTEMAPGRPMVYGVCERDAALVMMTMLP